jgi:hypothetical protein
MLLIILSNKISHKKIIFKLFFLIHTLLLYKLYKNILFEDIDIMKKTLILLMFTLTPLLPFSSFASEISPNNTSEPGTGNVPNGGDGLCTVMPSACVNQK